MSYLNPRRIQAIERWIDSSYLPRQNYFPQCEWFIVEPYRMYLRCRPTLIQETDAHVSTFVVASVHSRVLGSGMFWHLLQELGEVAKKRNFAYMELENVLTPRLRASLVQRGWAIIPDYTDLFFGSVCPRPLRIVLNPLDSPELHHPPTFREVATATLSQSASRWKE